MAWSRNLGLALLTEADSHISSSWGNYSMFSSKMLHVGHQNCMIRRLAGKKSWLTKLFEAFWTGTQSLRGIMKGCWVESFFPCRNMPIWRHRGICSLVFPFLCVLYCETRIQNACLLWFLHFCGKITKQCSKVVTRSICRTSRSTQSKK